MPVMMSDTYDALIEAGASEPKARAAAQEVAKLDAALDRLEDRITAKLYRALFLHLLAVAGIVFALLRVAA